MKDDAKEIFENLDIEGNNYLEYEQFVRAAIDKKIFLSDEALRMAFNFFDKENQGIITFGSILTIFKDCTKKGINTEEELKKIMKEIGINNEDLSINYSSFTQLITEILK